ncbi:hypothetical protein EJB05_14235, partial [Eragrostis curvula]
MSSRRARASHGAAALAAGADGRPRRGVLLRFPPEQAACLVLASLVCKPWRRLLCDREFLRRYSAFHHAPPLLDFLRNRRPICTGYFPRFVPTTSIPPLAQLSADWGGAWALDSRHGRILLVTCKGRFGEGLVVWDPTTGDWQELPYIPDTRWNLSVGAVLCADDGCDHLDCHGGPFRVVVLECNFTGQVTSAYSYSSETNAWSKPASGHTSTQWCIKWTECSAVIGDEICFNLNTKVLKYDLGKHCLSLMDDMPDRSWDNTLIRTEDGSLGVAGIRNSNLHLWSRKVIPWGVDKWVKHRVIELPKIDKPGRAADVIDFAEGQVRKVDDLGHYDTAVPYMRFYTPGIVVPFAYL